MVRIAYSSSSSRRVKYYRAAISCNPGATAKSDSPLRHEYAPRAKRLQRGQEVFLVETCNRLKDDYKTSRGNISWWSRVAEAFRLEYGLDSYNWQTARNKVTRLANERRQTRHIIITGQAVNHDQALHEAIDEWLSHIDEIREIEAARKRAATEEANHIEATQRYRDDLSVRYAQKRQRRSELEGDNNILLSDSELYTGMCRFL
ncbi:hypothetical protein EYZ11_012669 [Aspergillus tanneri]|uniref:Uncharacterized protein n=1 Tax=Aspergillus tanneri TaxID=1220188 RepID=A0A4S3J1S9_9EURO|nr:hypothetical protein EYZ11_012669 [Aspergillus tanneri]